MKYYKIIKDDSIVGVCSSRDFLVYQIKHGILLISDDNNGQYVQCEGSLYRDEWMHIRNPQDGITYETASVVEIDENEYEIIKEAQESGQEITVENPEPENIVEEPVAVADPTQEVTVEYVRDRKIAEMSATCGRIIEGGVDVYLSDNETHHFSLTTQDQLNFITLSTMLDNGAQTVPYHADGELCVFYSASDMRTVIETATNFKTYHVTYFNSLRNYIQSLDNIEDISNIRYGIEIPIQYQSDVLRALLAQ